MRYAFLLDGKEHHVTLEEHADGPKFLIDGDAFQPEVMPQGDGRFQVTLGDASFTFRLEDGSIQLGEQTLDVEVKRAKPVLQRAGGKGKRGQGTIKPPMPGKVVEVHVREGDEVTEGTPLLVLEAMKMQNDLKSAVAGVVKSVKGKAGQNVEATTVLVEIEPKADE